MRVFIMYVFFVRIYVLYDGHQVFVIIVFVVVAAAAAVIVVANRHLTIRSMVQARNTKNFII